MLHTTRYSKFAATFICAVGLLICFAQYTWAAPTPVDLNIVAHQDDDILFMNPDILNSVVAGHRQVTVYITSGSRDGNDGYALQREAGAIAGYQKLLQLADVIRADPHHFDDSTFTETFQRDSRYPAGCAPSATATPTPDTRCFLCTDHNSELQTPGTESVNYPVTLSIGGRNLAVARIGNGVGGPRVLLIFLRVQSSCALDGCLAQDPTQVDLATLFTTGDSQLQIGSDFPDQSGYTRQQLINQLVDIIKFVKPGILRTQDTADDHHIDRVLFDPETCPQICLPLNTCGDVCADTVHDSGCAPTYAVNFYDHTDHVSGARFAREALTAYKNLPGNRNQPTYSIYMGYNLEWNEPPAPTRISTRDFCLKKSIFWRYALDDDRATFDGGNSASGGFNCYSYFYIGYQQSATPAP